MGIFQQFPYTNFHEMNLDQIVKIVKNMLEEWAQYYNTWDNWKDTVTNQWAEMRSFINNYFDDLDVQEEINNKIADMVTTGEFSNIVDPYVPPAVSAWLAEHITTPEAVVIDDTLSISGACADAKAAGDAISDVESELNYFVDVVDLLDGVPLYQGSWIRMNSWDEATENTAATRLHTSVTLNNVDRVTILALNGFEYEVAFFDASNTLLTHLNAWQTNNRTIVLSAPATTMRLNIRNSTNTALTQNGGIHIYSGGYSLKEMYGGLYVKLASGFVDNSTSNPPLLTFDTKKQTVTVNKCYLLDKTGIRHQVAPQTVSYTAGTNVGTQTLVYDTTDGVVKPKYTSPAAEHLRLDNSTQIVMAYYHTGRLVNGTIATNLTYNINNNYFGNFPKSYSPLSEGQLINLKVCSYNLGVYNYGVSGAISEQDEATIITQCRNFFSEQNCDILGLQENRQILNTKSTNTEIYNYLYPYGYGFYNSTWLKSRYPLSQTGQSAFTSSGREYVYGTLDIDGLNVFVMSVHLALTGTMRAQEYTELIAILNQHEYFICFGDFNANSDGSTDPQTEYNNLLNAGYHIANGGYLGLMTTHPQDNKKLDNIVTSNNIIIANSYVPDVYADMHSDHLPIIAELAICS